MRILARGLTLLCLAWCVLAAAPAVGATPVQIGVLVIQDYREDEANWRVVSDYLAKQVGGDGFDVHVYDAAGLDRAMQTRAVDFIVTSPAHYVAVSQRMGLSAPLATLVRVEGGRPLHGIGDAILVRADEPLLEAVVELQSGPLDRALVRSDGQVVGLLSISDVGRLMSRP